MFLLHNSKIFFHNISQLVFGGWALIHFSSSFIHILLHHLLPLAFFFLRYLGETLHNLTIPLDSTEKHIIRPNPHLSFTVESLIYDHLLQGLAILRNTQDLILSAFEMSVIVCHNAKIVKMPDFSSTKSAKNVDETKIAGPKASNLMG